MSDTPQISAFFGSLFDFSDFLNSFSAIDELPLEEKHLIVERTLQLIKKQESDHQMSKAAEAMRDAYVNDPELTVFTSLDSEPFYEYEAE